MRSFLQNKISKVTALVILALGAVNLDTFAATYRASWAAGATTEWSFASTWQIQDAANQNNWLTSVNVPRYDDNVIIDNGKTVTIDVPHVIIKDLTITGAGSGANRAAVLDVNGKELHINGNLALIGGNGQRVAELRFSSGTVYLVGTRTIGGTTGNTSFGTGPNGIYVNSGVAPLPVELTSFTAAKRNNEVSLTWETASEKNNTGFEVQSSVDGKNYEAIAFVASKNGNSTSAQRYAFAHKTAGKEGLVYYRLKQVDMDGTTEYFTAKVVDLGRATASVNTFPNPFQNQFELNLTATATEKAQITVTDMTGKTVYAAEQNLTKGANTLKVELNNQPAGLYLLKATTGNQTYTNRLVKQ